MVGDTVSQHGRHFNMLCKSGNNNLPLKSLRDFQPRSHPLRRAGGAG